MRGTALRAAVVAAFVTLWAAAPSVAQGLTVLVHGPDRASHGETVTLIYELSLEEPPAAVQRASVTDDKCSPVTFVGGDTWGFGWLNPDEVHIYTCEYTIPSHTPGEEGTITHTVTGRGQDGGGNDLPETTDSHLIEIVHRHLHYEGVLTGSDGLPLAAGDQVVRFRVYDAESGGKLLWGPQAFDLGPTDAPAVGHARKARVGGAPPGRFAVVLGPEDTQGRYLGDAFRDDGWRWLELELETGPIAPRERILPTAYALRAGHAQLWNGMMVQTARGVAKDARTVYTVTFDPPFGSPPVVSVRPTHGLTAGHLDYANQLGFCFAKEVKKDEAQIYCRHHGHNEHGEELGGAFFTLIALGPPE